LGQRREGVDRDPDGGVLHDDRWAFAAHKRTSAKTHALVFFVGWDVENAIVGFDLFNDTCQLLAWHGRHKLDAIGYEIINDLLGYGQVSTPLGPELK
jgi:hypothetical protein